MTDLLLIHGSGHGAWCWRDLIPELSARGVTSRAIDLPGHGDTPAPIEEITLEAYADAIEAAIGEAGGPVALAGHSAGGFPISLVAERRPDLVRHLIYVCAYAPRTGLSLVDMRKEAPRQPILDAIDKSADGLAFTFRDDALERALFHDCPPGTIDYARAHLVPQAIKPQATPITLTERYASVPRSYIRCSEDQTIPPEYQTTMAEGFPPEARYEMATSHSPFFAQPARLAEIITEILT